MLILSGMALFLIAGSFWLAGRWLSLYGICVSKWSVRLLRIGIAVFIVLLCVRWRIAALVAVHLMALFALMEFAALVIRRVGKSQSTKKYYRFFSRIYHSGLIPVFITCLLFLYGFYNMGHIVRTEYTVTSDKLQSEYDIVLITDTHFDTVQSPDVLRNTIGEINALGPDLIVLAGDIVEEGTSKASMQEAFRVLGSLQSTYGTYYVYGNHDRQHHIEARTYTDDELARSIETNGITILSDQWVSLSQDLVLAGREDASNPQGRASSKDLLKDADRNHLIIAVDHQPIEVKENAAQGVDLQLSGHTHAGQIFPAGYFIEWFRAMNYGVYHEDQCTVIVSSGATGWGFPVRTQGKCEYVVVHLRKE